MKKKSKKQNKKIQLVEVVRSFSFKKNLGNYEMADFFCSEKAECSDKDAEKTSASLYQFCRNEVFKSVNKFLGETNKVDRAKSMDVGKDAAQHDAGSAHEEYINAH